MLGDHPRIGMGTRKVRGRLYTRSILPNWTRLVLFEIPRLILV
jgi:hypothetical protein